MSEDAQWFVFENLNDSDDFIVASSQDMVADIYTVAAGPFANKEDAEDEAERRRGG